MSTSIPTRLSSSDEKMYSPKHISAGEKLYSPKPSQITSTSQAEKRKVDIEPCGTFRHLMLSDLPPIPDVPILTHPSKSEPQEKEKHTLQRMETDAPMISKSHETSATKEAAQDEGKIRDSVVDSDKKEGGDEAECAEATTPQLRTWREAIKSRCALVNAKLKVTETRSIDDILTPVMQTDDYNELMKKVTNNSLACQ